jgi:hypothetical protein
MMNEVYEIHLKLIISRNVQKAFLKGVGEKDEE